MIFVHALGTAQIDIGGTSIRPNSARKFALLFYLAAERGRRISRATLQELMYPDKTDRKGRHALRELLYQVRQAGLVVDADAGSIELASGAVRSDYGELIEGDRPTAALIEAAAGGFLPGYVPMHSEAYAEWFEEYRGKKVLDICRVLLSEMHRAKDAWDWKMTERAARAVLVLDPSNEKATFALAGILAMRGSRIQAASMLDEYALAAGGRPDLDGPALVLRHRIAETPVFRRSQDVPLIGRERELRVLRDALQKARAGEANAVVLVGEAGIGKTRLARELARRATLESFTLQEAVAAPHDVHHPLGSLVESIRALQELPGALGCSPTTIELLQLITSTSRDSNRLRTIAKKGGDSYVAISTAVQDLVDAVTTESRLLLVLEDAHWTDSLSLKVVRDLVATSQSRRLCVILTTREPLSLSDQLIDGIVQLRVDRLTAEATRGLAAALLEKHRVSADSEMKAWFESSCTGSPLFLESVIAHYERTRERFVMPPRIELLLQKRLDSLTDGAVAALQFITLLGRHTTADRLERVLNVDRVEFLRVLAELDRARVLDINEDRLQPAHALLADEAVRRMGRFDKRLAHQCIATELERSHRDDSSVAWDCAEHWLNAAQVDRALLAVEECANHALRLGRAEAAARFLLRAAEMNIPNDSKRQLARQIIHAADLAANSGLVLRGFEMLGVDNQDADKDLELTRLRAVYRTGGDIGGKEQHLLACVESENEPIDQRVAIAISLLKVADSTGLSDLPRNVYAALPDALLRDASQALVLEYQILRSCIETQYERVEPLAREWIGMASAEPPATRCATLHNAGMAAYRAGMLPAALEWSEGAYHAASEAQLLYRQLMASTQIAEILRELERDSEAEAWLDVCDDIVSRFPTIADNITYSWVRLTLAIESRDVTSASKFFQTGMAAGIFRGSPLREAGGVVLRERMNVLAGTPVDDNAIEVLFHIAEMSTQVFLKDFAAATIGYASLMRSDAETVVQRFMEYVVTRRARGGLFPRDLRNAEMCVAERLRELAKPRAP